MIAVASPPVTRRDREPCGGPESPPRRQPRPIRLGTQPVGFGLPLAQPPAAPNGLPHARSPRATPRAVSMAALPSRWSPPASSLCPLAARSRAQIADYSCIWLDRPSDRIVYEVAVSPSDVARELGEPNQ